MEDSSALFNLTEEYPVYSMQGLMLHYIRLEIRLLDLLRRSSRVEISLTTSSGTAVLKIKHDRIIYQVVSISKVLQVLCG